MVQYDCVGFMVIENGTATLPQGIRPHGLWHFHATPRVGEVISMKLGEDDVRAYRVVAVHHAANFGKDTSSNAGDIYVEHIGSDVDFCASMRTKL